MSRVPFASVEEPLDTTIARLITTQDVSQLPLQYRPLIGIPASHSLLTEGGWSVYSVDEACIDAIYASGGEVRVVPTHPLSSHEDALDTALRLVLACDGLLFPGSYSDVDPCYYGQPPHPSTRASDPLLDQWTMLLALVARETLTPVFGICGGAERLNVALGGTLVQHIDGHRASEATANNWIRQMLLLDADILERCLRGAGYFPPDDGVLMTPEHPICCMHHQAPATLAPGMQAWGWATQVVEGFGYAGPQPWFAVGTMFHPEAGILTEAQEPLARFLFQSFHTACYACASSFRHALRAPRLRTRLMRQLVADPLAQRVLHGDVHRRFESADTVSRIVHERKETMKRS
jgi:putative glutamine amidotransferase